MMNMDWSYHKEVHTLVVAGRNSAALDSLARARSTKGDLPSPLVVLQARALMNLGQQRAAVDTLLDAAARGCEDFWLFHTLAAAYRGLSDWPRVFDATRQAQVLIGWVESRERLYRFTHDYFSPNLSRWEPWFRDHITAAPLCALEIGSWQGGSACWLLDRVIGPRGGTLTCIDPFTGSSEHGAFLRQVLGEIGGTLERLFDDNVGRTGRTAQLRKIVGFSQDVLPTLHGEQFDFIYIDGAHEAKFVIQDAVLCWGLLRSGGWLLFDDVPFTFRDRPEQDTARAIEFFLSVFADEIELLYKERQLLLRRR